MAYSVTLSDGTKLDNLALNGNNFISAVKLTEEDFKGKLGKVTITDDNGKSKDYTDMTLVQVTQMDNESWFILAERAQDEVSELKAEVEKISDIIKQKLLTKEK